MSYIRAFVQGQYKALSAKDSKERLRYTVAGIKDGTPFDYAGSKYGKISDDMEDVVFFEEDIFELARITTSRIDSITEAMNNYFGGEAEEVEVEDEKEAEDVEEQTEAETIEDVEEDVQEDATDAIKKLIKKGKFKKAQKMIDEIGGHKKLQKKLNKAMEDN